MVSRLLLIAVLLATVSDAVKVRVRVHHMSSTNQKIWPFSSSSSSTSTSSSSNSSTYAFTPVTSIQARVQGNLPAWDATTKTWVASFGKTYADQFRAVLDTVNTASVEGALMYVQAEGINVDEQSVKCQRKNNMQYVVFYQITVAQPNASLAYYGGKHQPEEYCPFVAMDGGRCTPAGEDFPDACKQYDGIGGQPKLGHCVGANEQSTDPRAPYSNNYWFSFPNSCVTQGWSNKTDSCRTQYSGGLCAPGVTPDGVNCTFTYSILGYLNIDDLVGITDGTAAKDGKSFSNFTTFCNAGNVEFSATNTGSGFTVKSSIDFWKNPGNVSANTERTQKMVDMYNKLAPKAKTGTMKALPAVSDLTKANPPCYLNSAVCAKAPNGCRRVLYSQLCEVCQSAASDCVAAPGGFTFPTLEYKTSTTSSGSGSVSGSLNGSSNSSNDAGSSPSSKKSVAAGVTSSAVALLFTVAAAALV